tara:strand:- start:287 stop:535 length:249 start_codon:yes stop_codon:yes gene_type:complete
MNTNKKQYTLDDGSITTAHEVAEKVGITISNARSRLSTHSDPIKIWGKKQNKNKGDADSFKMRRIKSRGMFDDMLVLAMKKI